ncbi:patched domain-containing protein 3-like [Ochotona princeps]|uniref:patched domain-containing protein 3-like n=1 Tax=Ochotona princeps TaxID=9978 RepID=UPI0027146455|nr:patched domain-containing protein 3-like [Ochotona princeps]
MLADFSTQSEYAWFHNLLESRTYTKLLVDGLDTFFKSPLGGLSPSDNPDACMQVFRSWLQSPIGLNFASQFTWQKEGGLKAFQIQLVPQYHSGSQELSEFMTMLRHDLSKFKNADVHAYNKLFVFYESDSGVLSSTLSNMAWAVLAVTVVSFALLPSLWSAALVIFILILIDVALVGFMYYWNLPLNMLTMVNLIISIGFSIDYAAHMCHTFSHCVGLSRDMRVFETLVLIGNPIFHGVMSTQLGVLVLAHTGSHVLEVFFKMMTLVLTLAFAHGAILLPVLLSLFGPIGHEKEPLNVALTKFKRGLTIDKILSKKYPQ